MSGPEYLWRLPKWADNKFEALMTELEDENLSELDDRYWAIIDEVKRLPGFPQNSTQYSLIRREVTTVSSSDLIIH